MSGPLIKKTVYFVRHGQSVDNRAPVYQSDDSPLNETGRGQAEVIANRMVELPFDTIIASPITRARQTAEIIAKTTNKKLEFSELFVERRKPSIISGKPYTDIEATKAWREWEASLYTPGTRVQDGESYDDIVARADQALKFLENRPESSLVVVTHGYFPRVMIARILLQDELSHKAFRNFQKAVSMENTGLTIIRYQSALEEEFRWHLWSYNDHAHLES